MFKRIIIALCFLTTSLISISQPTGRGQGSGQRPSITGRMYGKIVDELTGKAIEDASVQFWQSRIDSVKQQSNKLLGGQLTESNGDFSIEGLPLTGPIKLKVTALGYKTIEKMVSFDIKPGKPKALENMLNLTDKDLGNIKLAPNINELKTVTVKSEEPTVKMTIDKKIYSVDKNLTATGGNAQDAMKNIPAVSVDIDGNVSMRNATPQIFVDGRPTTLTLDQIPADNIQSIEVITNPSVKYDASGGIAGIINIVLKKDKRMGYNGSARAGIDKRAKINAGLDLNIREKKINFFISTSINQRKSIADGWSSRFDFLPTDTTKTYQQSHNIQQNLMSTNRIGFDYLIDNRNTLTISTNYTIGKMLPSEQLNIQYTDLSLNQITSTSSRLTESYRRFQNWGNSLQYKHLFPVTGKELTADLNANLISSKGGADARAQYYDAIGNPYKDDTKQSQIYNGSSSFYTAQVDFINPLNDFSKIEMGARSAFRLFNSTNINQLFNPSDTTAILISQRRSYSYNDLVTAAYMNYASQHKKLGYQVGLRIESSNYKGKIMETGQTFSIPYPISLFPSFGASYKLKDNQDLNLNLSRRINRPGFFQLMPYIDFSDSLNLSRGNPALKPEFTYASELSYLYAYKNNQSLMINAYAKMSTGLITRYISQEYNNELGKNIIVTSYENARQSSALGIEIVSKNTIKKWFDITSNLNIYQSQIKYADLENNQLSWFAKINANFKLLKVWNLQFSGDYFSKMGFQQGGDGGGGRMMGGGGGTQNSAQGYTLPNYGVDIAIKRDFLKTKTLSVTLNFIDIFHTRRNNSMSMSNFFQLESFKQRDWQFFRLNISYRFGKFDTSIFKRKNNRNAGDGEGMM